MLGNLYRFVEPVILLMVRQKAPVHGYELLRDVAGYALTDSTVDSAAVYRCLRQMECQGLVTSQWELAESGPPRRLYLLTEEGEERLQVWAGALERLADGLGRFVADVRQESPR